jgi:thiamine pyrophosphokinase
MERCALVFTGGKGPSRGFDKTLIPQCSYVCAADSGIDTAIDLGYTVDEAIGDFDSLKNLDMLKEIPHRRLPREKDITDTEALLRDITSIGMESYVLVGGGEGRFDHLLHLYTLFETYGPPLLWFTARECLHMVKDSKLFSEPEHTTISVIPALARGNSFVTSTHLRWELRHFQISMLNQSISNMSLTTHFSLQVEGAPVFVSIPFPQ